ncbi:MAG TPA: Gx transporter family protein, partial [Sphaerochaeta sp.]|nr:Gx transporter family protein [Sphaerochaeta sp.]
LFSYLFLISLAGTMSSGYAMKLLKSLLKERVSLIGISVVGAFVSNLSQLQVASWIVYGPAIWVAAPLMLGLGMITSIILGVFGERYLRHGSFPAAFLADSFEPVLPTAEERAPLVERTVALIIAIGAILFAKGPIPLLGIAVLMYVIQGISGRKIRLFPPLMLLSSLIVLSLFEPNGQVIVTVGTLALTKGSIALALTKGLRLIALLSASQSLVSSNPRLKGRLGSLLVLALSYFGILTSCFRTAKGSLPQRIDGALFCAAEGSLQVSANNQQERSSSALIIITAILVVGISIASRVWG